MKMKRRIKIQDKKLKGFSLMEILIALAIIGILAALVATNMFGFISKAKSVEAQEHLDQIYTLEKQYFYMQSKYSPNLPEIGYEQAKLVTEDGKGNYKFEIVTATNNKFLLRATAVVDFDGDGIFNVWENDQDKNIKEVTPD
jgi:type IV pilus assembly protein PilE